MISQNISPVYVNRAYQNWTANGGVYGDGGVHYQSSDIPPTLDLQFAGATAISSQVTFTRASTGSYFNSAGVLSSAAVNEARLDYNPSTLAAQGLLIEEQRVNLLTYSSDFDNAAWTTVNGTTTPGATTSISGAVNAALGTTNGTQYQLSQGVTISSGATITGSIFLKPSGINETEIVLLAGNNTTPYGRATFNVSTGVISVAATSSNGGTNVSATITAINNGWYRCTVTVTYPAVTSAGIRINAVGATGGVFIYGAQLEAGAFATSYIPTTSSQATRAPDIALVNTLSPWYNASEGTLYAEYNIPYALTTGSSPRLFALNGVGGPAIDEMPLFTSQAAGKAASFNSFAASVNAGRIDSTPAFVANTVTKAAAGYATNSRAVTANASTPVTSTTVYTIPTITIARLGSQDSFGNSAINGWLRRLTYYPRKLSDAELQSLTT